MVETACGLVQVAREGAGPAVVVIHGGPGGFDQGLMYARHLRDRGCEVIAPSRPGYLRTPLDSGRTPAEQADLFAEMLDELTIDRATVLGYSSGGPAAVHLAARHPDQVRGLLLDSAVTMRFITPVNLVERLLLFSSFGAWWWYQVSQRWPALATSTFVDGFSTDLDRQQKRSATGWIRSDASRFQLVQELWGSFAPWTLRQPGFNNDEHNESDLTPLPFHLVNCPTLIAHGSNDGGVPFAHALHSNEQIAGAELMLVEGGHHLLPAGRGFEAVAQRQLTLARN
jgi:pimeloyl-ACP methyl ester carboxylesterase